MKQLMIWLVIKLMIKLQNSHRVHYRIVQNQLKKKYDQEISKERCTSPEKKQKNINDIRLI